jgi:sulfhydrogenase subunit delta
MECRIRENRCLLEEDGDVCLGPVTRSGCNARCPSILVPCEGCRGEVAEANRDELYHLLLETGLKGLDIRLRMQRFAGGGSDQADD